MADTKISALPAATLPLAGTEVLPIVQGGATDKVAVKELDSYRPAFRAFLATNQSPSDGVLTKVAFANTQFDTASAFDTVNNRFQPTVAGYYQLNAEMDLGGSSSYAVTFYKNGASYDSGQWWLTAATAEIYLAASTLVYLNGTTDYVEVYARAGATAVFYGSAGGTYSVFSGVLVRAA